MPFVEILTNAERCSDSLIPALIEVVGDSVGTALTTFDPEHLVTPEMVDIRVTTIGPHDRIGPDLYVTVLARHERARDRHKLRIVGAITAAIRRLAVPEHTLVELVLTNRVSLYDYGE